MSLGKRNGVGKIYFLATAKRMANYRSIHAKRNVVSQVKFYHD